MTNSVSKNVLRRSVHSLPHRECKIRPIRCETELIETVHEVAIAGQSGTLAAPDYAATARRLQAAGRGLATLAEAAIVIADPVEDGAWTGPESSH